MEPQIAVVDDERSITQPVAFSLRRAGFTPIVFNDGEAALRGLRAHPPALIVLDIMMPRMDGLQLCKSLREEGQTVPIIFLSSRDEELDRLLGFEMGGDDYLTKPFSMRELVARVKALIRRSSAGVPDTDSHRLNFEGVEIDSEAAICRYAERTIALTITELRILLVLVADPGTIKSRTQLIRAAFPQDLYANERAVDSHIKRIRRKLTELGVRGELIEAVYGMGYRLRRRGDSR